MSETLAVWTKLFTVRKVNGESNRPGSLMSAHVFGHFFESWSLQVSTTSHRYLYGPSRFSAETLKEASSPWQFLAQPHNAIQPDLPCRLPITQRIFSQATFKSSRLGSVRAWSWSQLDRSHASSSPFFIFRCNPTLNSFGLRCSFQDEFRHQSWLKHTYYLLPRFNLTRSDRSLRTWCSATAKAWIFQMMMLLYSCSTKMLELNTWGSCLLIRQERFLLSYFRVYLCMTLSCVMFLRDRMLFVSKSRTTNFHLLHIIFFFNYSSHVLEQMNSLQIDQTKNSFDECSIWSF